MRTPSRHHADAFAALAPLRAWLAAADDSLMRDQIAVAQIPAPSGDEADRAAWVRDRFAALGLADIRIDEAGNVIGRRPGRRADEPVVVCAHLDTVFSRDTPHAVTRDGRRFRGPSITDNSRGLAAMVALAAAIDPRATPLARPVEFVGTTGEDPSAAMAAIPATAEIRKGDKINIVGAAGPMGTMHVIRDLCQGVPNVTIFAGDLSDERLAALRKLSEPLAQKNKLTLKAYNPSKDKLAEKFNYIVLMAPVPALVAQAVKDAAPKAAQLCPPGPSKVTR